MHERSRTPGCLDQRTLAVLAAGRYPRAGLEQVRSHLPQCPRCRAAIAASLRGSARAGDTVLLPPPEPPEPLQPKLGLRVSLVLLSLLSIAAAAWFGGGDAGRAADRVLGPAARSARAPATLSAAAPVAPAPGASP